MRPSPRIVLGALVALILSAGGAGVMPLVAQEAQSGIVVRVRAEAGQPLVGAQVVVVGLGIGALTDATGTARLPGLQPGSKTVLVRYLGYAEQQAMVILEEGKVSLLEFDLQAAPIQLAEVRVKAPRRSTLHRNGFFERRGGGFGVFMTREQIEDMQPRYMSDVLRRVAGISLSTTGFGGTSRATMRGTKVLGNCPIQYYLDGTMTSGFNIDEVMPSDVEGVEIYRGASTIPPAYNKGTALCGVILIWTRVQ